MKKNLNLRRISVLLIIPLLSVSCKLSHKFDNLNPRNQIGNLLFPGQRNFIQSELVVGRRICAALKKKREYFQTFNDREQRFKFQGTLTDCQGTTTLDTSFEASIATSSLEYSATTARDNYFRDIITDQSGALNDLCVSLRASDNVSNTVMLGAIKYTVNLYITNNYDHYDFLKERSDGKGGFSVDGAESISVITQNNQADSRFFGVEKVRARFTSCGSKYLPTIKQTWTEGVGNFPPSNFYNSESN